SRSTWTNEHAFTQVPVAYAHLLAHNRTATSQISRYPPFDPERLLGEIDGMRIDRKRLEEICRRNDVELLLLFGSAARGEDTEQSDVDLLVRFSKRKSLLDLVRIEREFAEALGRKVDLLTEGSLSPYLRDQILGEAAV